MDNHITYLFGAGASYEAMPVQKELAEDMVSVFTELNLAKNGGMRYPTFFTKSGQGPLGQQNKYFLDKENGHFHIVARIDRYLEIAQKAAGYPSVDTLAKEYYLRGQELMSGWVKEAVDYYFYLRTFQPNLFNNISKIKRPLKMHDPRYIGMITSLLSKNDVIEGRLLPKNVSALNYNYDLELEWAIAQPKEDTLDGFLDPNQQNEGIVHLNGRANVFNMNPSKEGFKWWDDRVIDLKSSVPTEISYAWEKSFEKSDQVGDILKKTTHLVVIGYSFPAFNREIDRKILKAKELEKIYIQDKKEALDGIENRVKALLGTKALPYYITLGSSNKTYISSNSDYIPPQGIQMFRPEIQIELINSIDQFHIPFEINS